MNYCDIKTCDVANGPGVRVSLFVSGCPHHCKGCFNPETWDFRYGETFDDLAMQKLLDALEPDYIEGLTILGGEPLAPENRYEVLQIINEVRERYPDKSIWLYTGYRMDHEFLTSDFKTLKGIFSKVNRIVDGPFIDYLKDLSLRFRGSSNQRILTMDRVGAIHDVTENYR